MNMRTLIGVAGAAALAFGSAHAVKIDSEFSVTYAKETLSKAATGDATTHDRGGRNALCPGARYT